MIMNVCSNGECFYDGMLLDRDECLHTVEGDPLCPACNEELDFVEIPEKKEVLSDGVLSTA